MRTIKAKDIKCGMTIEWASKGLTKKAVVKGVGLSPKSLEVIINVAEGYVHYLDYISDVTVVEEPKDNQPPEPTALGARVLVNGMELVRLNNNKSPWYHLDGSVFGFSWNGLCGMGQVIVVDADPSWPSEEAGQA